MKVYTAEPTSMESDVHAHASEYYGRPGVDRIYTSHFVSVTYLFFHQYILT
jgi:hypothetical protein